MKDDPVLVVIYGLGSLAPMRIAQAARALGVKLIFAVSADPHSRSMMPALNLFGTVIDVADKSAKEAAAIISPHSPSGIVTFSEWSIQRTADIAAELGLPYHQPEDIPAITRKDAQRRRLEEHGLSDITLARLDSVGDTERAIPKIKFPAIVKPISGASSRNTREVYNKEQLEVAIAEAFQGSDHAPPETSLLVEETLRGRETKKPWGDYIAVDCVVVDGKARPVFVSSKFALAPPFRERGAYGGRSVEDPDLVTEAESLACQAVEAVGVQAGFGDVEIKITPYGLRVIEVNGRLGAWVDDLAVRAGLADPASIAICAALGRPIPEIKRDGIGKIVFHYIFVPPVGAGRVLSIGSPAPIRAVPGVEKVVILGRPGMDVNWRRGGAGSVGFAVGQVDSHDDLIRTVEKIESIEWIEYQ
jgi:predicted ATP-grasp superfamily ATP-dependent carboligase